MRDKERLSNIEEYFRNQQDAPFMEITYEDFDWLIEQNKRYQKNFKKLKETRDQEIKDYYHDYDSGYFDGLNTAINIIEKGLGDEE